MGKSITEIEEKIQQKELLRGRLIHLQDLQAHDDIADDEFKIIENEVNNIKKN